MIKVLIVLSAAKLPILDMSTMGGQGAPASDESKVDMSLDTTLGSKEHEAQAIVPYANAQAMVPVVTKVSQQVVQHNIYTSRVFLWATK